MIVSVIVPVYNVEKYLRMCLDSILAQTYNNLQIILINDGSTDLSGDICNEYKEKDDRIEVIHQENKGLSEARNVGIRNAKGEYVICIDSDDGIAKDMIELLVRLAIKYNADISACSSKRIQENDRIPTEIFQIRSTEIIWNRTQALVEHLYANSLDVVTWNKLFKKSLFKKIEYPKGKLYEDMLTTYKLINESDIVVFINEPKYYYRKRKGSIGNMQFSDKWYGLQSALDKVYSTCSSLLKNKKQKEEFRVAYLIWSMVLVNKMICSEYYDKSLFENLQEKIKKDKMQILKNNKLEKIRKCELLVFAYNLKFYKKLYFLYKEKARD